MRISGQLIGGAGCSPENSMATSIAAPHKRNHSHNDKKYRTGASEAAEWRVGRVADEAHVLYDFMKRNGRSVPEMVELISVSDVEYAELCKWAEDKPPIASRLNDMMEFRDKTLKAFLTLVELHEASAQSLSGDA